MAVSALSFKLARTHAEWQSGRERGFGYWQKRPYYRDVFSEIYPCDRDFLDNNAYLCKKFQL